MSIVESNAASYDPYISDSVATIRNEPLNLERLEEYAVTLAASLRIDQRPRSDEVILLRAKANAEALRGAHKILAAAAAAGEPSSIDVEWLLDNFTVVEDQLREVHEDLPRTYYHELPKTEKGLPRVYEIALGIIAHTDSAPDEHTLERFLNAFQRVSPLSIGETWAFPIMLRLALIENLRRIAQQILARRGCRQEAVRLVQAAAQGQSLPIELDCVERCAPTIVEVLQLLEEEPSETLTHRNDLEQRLRDRGWDLAEILRDSHRGQAANQVTIGNLITSMRLISSLDWMVFFEQVNLAEKTLREDPAEVYAAMDAPSRDRYRRVLERIAKRSGKSDLETAQRVVETAQQAQLGHSPFVQRHIGHYLLGEGKRAFSKSMGYRPKAVERIVDAILDYPLAFYLGGVALLVASLLGTLTLSLVRAGIPWPLIVLMNLLAIIPASELAIAIVNFAVTICIPPRFLPKLELKEGIPASRKTLAVMPCLITSESEIRSLAKRLESHYLSNPDPALHFALLSDWADSKNQETKEDLALLSLATSAIAELNRRHTAGAGGPFLLLHRRRTWNAAEGCWMGWERKRGKLMELNQWLRGEETSFETVEGDARAIRASGNASAVTYVITLDADTQLPPGAARKLVGALSHPLNQPRFTGDRINSGYVLLQPRVGVALMSVGQTWYSRIFANSPGIDPYATAASDVYQDLFGEGSFTGKGIYDLAAFENCLAKAFPENHILSHDLIEGCHSRVGLVSDIEVIDGFPSRYEADARRQHRWARGDWQLLPWLFPRTPTANGRAASRLSWLSRWKIIDNLRRSLVPASLLLFIIAGLCVQSWLAVAVALIVLTFPLLLRIFMTIRHRPSSDGVTRIRYAWRWEISRALLQWALQIALLPHRAFYLTDAIVRTLYRLSITRRRLLEWESAAVTEARINRGKWSVPTLLWCSSLLAIALPFFLPWQSLIFAAPLLVAWFAAPLIVIGIDQPALKPPPHLEAEQKASIRRIARRTWFFFEEFVNEKGNWLPPDNVQEYPLRKIAYRVSPTNEGLFLASALVARDFGFVTLGDVISLWENNLRSWEQLEGLHGHPFNWYDTQTLEPLRPRYVSTVDSGNLAVCLLTVRIGLDEYLARPVFGPAQWEGLRDSTIVFRELVTEVFGESAKANWSGIAEILQQLSRIEAEPRPPATVFEWRERFAALKEVSSVVTTRMESVSSRRAHTEGNVLSYLRRILRHIDHLSQEFSSLCAWIEQFDHADQPAGDSKARWKTMPPDPHAKAFMASPAWRRLIALLEAASTLPKISALLDDSQSPREDLRREWGIQEGGDAVKQWMDELDDALGRSASAAKDLIQRQTRLSLRMESLAQRMEFGFLFNARRRLFSIGFNVDEGRLDQSHYDMLASEARLATYFAIVKGDIEHRSWFFMGRGLTEAAGHVGLVSWGGGMFEFLMPQLFQKSYIGSLIAESCRMAVARQQEYGRQCNVPWGISESAFSSMAANHDYHYRSFGTPGIGLKRGLGKDLVISPYATMLAIEFDPRDAFENLMNLAKVDALGPFGFFEAVDYTKSRMPKGKQSLVVRCYMAHHHGMSILAMANLLLDGVVRRRFHEHPLGKAGELLLQERMPDIAPLVDASDSQHDIVETPRTEQDIVSRKLTGYQSPVPKTHLLTNGQYSLMFTSAGAGYSAAGNTAITRWRRDATNDQCGQFIYLRDLATGQFWSAGYQPTRAVPSLYEAIFSIDKAEIRRRDHDAETHYEVTISPDHLVEIRTLKITNHSERPLELEFTSYAEIVLGSHAADLAHPAFQKLFVETEIIKDRGAILARRRPRSASEQEMYAFHVISPSPQAVGDVECESSRDLFLGRGHNVDAPVALLRRDPLSGSAGAVLDPIFALRQRVVIPPHEHIQVSFATGIASSRDEALALVDHYRDLRHITHAFEMAWAFHQAELRQLHITPAKSHQYQRWAGPLLYPDAAWRAPANLLAANKLGQPTLWRYGVSGDFPILTARFSKEKHLDSVRELLIAHRFWRRAGFIVDLVFINEYPGSYLDGVHEQFITLLNEIYHQPGEPPPNVALVRSSQAPPEDVQLLDAAASVVLRCDQADWESTLGATLMKSLLTPESSQTSGGQFELRGPNLHIQSPPSRASRTTASTDSSSLSFANPWGGFSPDGAEYRMQFHAANRPPRPWSNVLANPRFGTLITESGGGYTWLFNSREFKLTSWSNDPSLDLPSEWLYLRDELSGEIFYPLPQNAESRGKYAVAHSAGYSRFLYQVDGIDLETTIGVPSDDPVKIVCIRIVNRSSKRRSLSLTYFVEWVLGVNRDVSQLHVRCTRDPEFDALLARNPYIQEFAEQTAFLTAVGAKPHFLIGRQTFLGRQQSPALPAALLHRQLPPSSDGGGDPGGAVQVTLSLAAGQQEEVVFLLGGAESKGKIPAILQKYSTSAKCVDAIKEVCERRREEFGVLSIETPSAATNLLMNQWLQSQVQACRVWGRSAFYQSGGAYGFRDQLQDVMAAVYWNPQLAREHLLRAASHQYLEGDVQHWWHPPLGRGTRTRFADDYLWLLLVAAHYIKITGDDAIFNDRAPFLTSHLLEPHEHERYELPTDAGVDGTLYEHCLKALDRAFRMGSHGLPLMGCGDWNDGMNKVGEGGQGESVWQGWFLLVILEEFLPLMRSRGDIERANEIEAKGKELRASLESHAWDGQWYRRAYFDDGTPLGSAQNDECQIDSIAQSWAVIAGADRERCQLAMNQVWERLVRRDEGLVLLFAPPFQNSALDPGYIKGYLAGIRENGGQYTHAALWVAQALALLGQNDRAWEILEMINPIHHGESAAKIAKYQVEPYVVAADVYGVPPNLGRGGWTWYTGSAAWMYRIILETILGFSLRADRLEIRPRMPNSWPGFKLNYRFGTAQYHIEVHRQSKPSSDSPDQHLSIKLDGQPIEDDFIPLVSDAKTHQVNIAIFD